jgi:hypothetical protein
MKKWVIALFSFCAVIFASPLQERTLNSAALRDLATNLGIDPNEDLVSETQKRWLRKPGQERWEVAELPPEERAFVLNWAKEQGLYDAWLPACTTYDKAIILGATTSRMQLRLDYLREMWNEGVRFDEIVWLTGDRPLDKRVDSLIGRCQTEAEAARILWEEASLPEEMRNLSVVFIAAPMKNNGTSRPNRQDTLTAWLKTEPEPCRILLVSSQPHCGAEFAAINATLPQPFLFDLVGPGTNPENHPTEAAVTLDSIARWIYTIGEVTKTH